MQNSLCQCNLHSEANQVQYYKDTDTQGTLIKFYLMNIALCLHVLQMVFRKYHLCILTVQKKPYHGTEWYQMATL